MARDEPDPRFLGGETAVLTNVQDMALVVAISHDGAADIHASVSKEKAAAMLRYIADQWDPPSAGVAAGPQATPPEVADRCHACGGTRSTGIGALVHREDCPWVAERVSRADGRG